MNLNEEARSAWQRHMADMDHEAVEEHALTVRSILNKALGRPSNHFVEPQGAGGLLRDPDWLGSVALRDEDDSVWVLAQPTPGEDDSTHFRLYVLDADGPPGPPSVVAPPFNSVATLGRALEHGVAYDDWVEHGMTDDVVVAPA